MGLEILLRDDLYKREFDILLMLFELPVEFFMELLASRFENMIVIGIPACEFF